MRWIEAIGVLGAAAVVASVQARAIDSYSSFATMAQHDAASNAIDRERAMTHFDWAEAVPNAAVHRRMLESRQ